MATSPGLTAFVDELVASFNRRSMDLPDGFFTRHTQLRLNGMAFEEMLGRSPSDPLILMLARGAAGYRFTAKAVQYAIPDATLQRGELDEATDGDAQVVRGECWLSGHFGDTGEPAELLVRVEMRFTGGSLARADASIDPAAVERLRASRLRG